MPLRRCSSLRGCSASHFEQVPGGPHRFRGEPTLRNLNSVKCAQPIALLVVLGACGDDDGNGAAPDPGSTTNTVPTIAGVPDTMAVIGQTYEFAPEATDPDQDMLTFAVENRPGWASFSPSTGRLSGTPTTSHVGTYGDIVISVTDGKATRSLSAFSISVTSVSGTSSVTLSWTAPTRNTDGSTLTDLAGYRVHYGTSAGSYTHAVPLPNKSMTSVVIEDLTPARWYFAVKAYNSAGVESAFSDSVNKLIE